MQQDMIVNLLISLGLTLLFELIFSLAFKVRNIHDIILVILVNFLTNPPVVLTHNILERGTSMPQIVIVLLLETSAVVIEGFCYKYSANNIRRPFWFSLGANAFSYLAGISILFIL